MNDIYQRLKEGKPFDKNLKVYTKEQIIEVKESLVSQERYEECDFIDKILDKFSHNKNYTKC